MPDNNVDKKIKIIRIIARLNVGGPALHTILLTEGLSKSIFCSLLVTGRVGKGEEDILSLAENKAVKPLVIAQLRRNINFIRDLIAFLKIFSLIFKERPQIMHTHTAKAGALGRLASVLYNLISPNNKIKIFHTFHGSVLQGYFGRIRSRIFIWIERILAYFTDRIVVVSKGIKEELLNLKIGSLKKITVIPLGLEIEELLSLPLKRTDSILRVGMVGRLVQIKNHRMFLEVAKSVLSESRSQSNNTRFTIIGDGELREGLEDYACLLGIRENIEFWGWRSKTSEIYSPLDIVALTSLNEGTPLSLIEAMAAARPVVATEVGGVRDLFIKTKDYGLNNNSQRFKIYDNGILCKSGDVEGMTQALNLLLTNDWLRSAMGDCGRQFAKERFSKERLINDIEILYNTCLKKE